ncbi:hepatocyte nuclear factor 3-alpha-like isoform X2 [Schistocerca gregaria]|uniref:hepatocyte nuclear factor 3-alpha-like isoform X2 n=1 Tax=Schistocerca gregaria TaxID=7010 RepID=UPI00211DCB1C|nr:hepatocyte nuclear factor 3-alpha-like isoform X2 [Schistocerca gregaria]
MRVSCGLDDRFLYLTSKGGEGMVKAEKPAGPDDDDLTSLTWLQDKNLLKGMNLRTASNAGAQGSPTSDYVDEGSCCSTGEPPASDSSGCSSSGRSPASPGSAIAVAATATATGTTPGTTPVTGAAAVAVMAARGKHPQHVPYDPLVHVNSKPPYSFSCLIFMAIEDSPGHALPVKEIYAWILDHFPYFKNAPTGWKNSVRHNLSLNKCFRKVEKAPQNLGKGSLWMVDPMYRPNLVQALAKSPFHPYSTIVSRTASVNSSPGSGSLPSTPAKAPPSPGRAARQQSPPATAASSSGNGSGCGSNSSSVSTGSANSNSNSNNNNSSTGTNSNSSTTSNTSTSVSPASANNSNNSNNNNNNNNNSNNNVPDPTLFPFLSRRLALSTTPQSGSPPPSQPSAQVSRDDSLDDVDAAAAMLALKHAHLRIPRRDDWYKRLREETSEAVGLRKKMRVSSRPGQTEERMVITTSPSEDHTYSAALNLSARSSGTVAVSTTPAGPHGPHAPPSTTSSPDEAFEEGSDSDDGTDGKNTRLGRGATVDTVPSVTSAHRILYNHQDRGDTSDEERRKIAEGADALLNLAGIRTDGGALSPPTSLVAPSPAPLPLQNPAPAPQTTQPPPSSVYSGPRSRRRKKPPPPSSRAIATQKYQHHRSSSGHGSGSHGEKRGSGSSTSSRR